MTWKLNYTDENTDKKLKHLLEILVSIIFFDLHGDHLNGNI